MICPNCGTEYREGFTHCTDCDVDLIAPPPPSEPLPQVDLIQVFESGNPALIPVIESLFEDAEIEYMTKSEPIQHLFGWGTFGSNLNYVIGPVQFFVRAEDAEQARALITPLDPSGSDPSDEAPR